MADLALLAVVGVAILLFLHGSAAASSSQAPSPADGNPDGSPAALPDQGDMTTPDATGDSTSSTPSTSALPAGPQGNSGLQAFAIAIATAEGYYVSGSAPNRANNPGSIKVPGWTGPTTGAESISVFPDPQSGWDALTGQLQLIASGSSHVYTPTESILTMAQSWTDTQGIDWATNVIASLNQQGWPVDYSTPIGSVLNG